MSLPLIKVINAALQSKGFLASQQKQDAIAKFVAKANPTSVQDATAWIMLAEKLLLHHLHVPNRLGVCIMARLGVVHQELL